jgi:hypothetical protein
VSLVTTGATPQMVGFSARAALRMAVPSDAFVLEREPKLAPSRAALLMAMLAVYARAKSDAVTRKITNNGMINASSTSP